MLAIGLGFGVVDVCGCGLLFSGCLIIVVIWWCLLGWLVEFGLMMWGLLGIAVCLRFVGLVLLWFGGFRCCGLFGVSFASFG